MNHLEKQKLLRKINKAKDAHNWEHLSKLCRKLAEFYLEQGQYNDAVTWFNEEKDAADIQGDAFGVANANRMIGEMYTELGDFEMALEYINKYLEYSKTAKDKVEEQRALATLGRTYFCWASELKNSTDKTNLHSILKQCCKAYIKSLYICENELGHVGNRETCEMKARILFNLGLVSELQEDIEIAQDYIAKAILMCQEMSLHQDLHRCFIAQGMLFFRQNLIQLATSSLDKAYNIAQNLPNKVEKSVVVLLQKAEIYLSLSNFHSAKNVLTKAYKLKTPNEVDRTNVEKLLKITIALCKSEDKLAITSLDDFKTRKELYEKLGDGCSCVRNFKQAVQYYVQMLECAEKLGETNEKLLPCYVSLAQTFKDDKQYDLALDYLKKELELSESIPSEACKTFITISEILELKGETYPVVSDVLNKAVELGEKSGNIKLYLNVLKSLLQFQKNNCKNELAEQTADRIKSIEIENDIKSDESSDEDDTPDIGKDIDLDNVLSDVENDNEEYDRPRVRNKRSLFKIKRNEKGETQLHVAIIKGDLNRAKRLIEQGHPVKEQDLNGWTPLHEACNHGHVDIVDYLLENGADINDPGGRGCKGITPLHDAASCGHFDIVQLLLDKGASVTALTDDNETVLDCLQEWRKRVELDHDDELVYEKLKNEIKNLLQAAGHITSKKKPVEIKKCLTSKTVNLRIGDDVEDSNEMNWRSVSPVLSNHSDGGSDSGADNYRKNTSKNKSLDACVEYKNAIEGVRKPKEQKTDNEVVLMKNNEALLPEENYIDDWLEDDIGIIEQNNKKKRKIVDYLERDRIRTKITVKKTKQDDKTDQISETVAEVHEEVTPIPSTLNIETISAETATIQAQPSQMIVTHSNLIKVRIKIDEKIFLIPLPNNVDSLTLQWLFEECSRRYFKLEGVEPIVQIKTKDGAILSAEDPLMLVCNEELKGEILSWKTIPLVERYKETCKKIEQNLDSYILKKLEVCRVTRKLELDYLALTPSLLKPIFLCLKHDETLKQIDISGNVIGDEGTSLFCQALLTMESLSDINLSCNNISDSGFHLIFDTLNKKSIHFLTNFKTLDLSYNLITDRSLDEINNLKLILCNMEKLSLDFCGLT